MLSHLFSRSRVGLVLAGVVAGLGLGRAQAHEVPRPVVVELYTSQGCSSCPPADALLTRLAARKDVLALSLPVTYWDMLGWKDTLAGKANTDRQKAYAAAMGRGGIYTPQMIIDGATELVGSRKAAVEKVIAAREADMRAVPVVLSLTPTEIHVRVAAAPDNPPREATIWLFAVEPKATVAIAGGENGGRTITYSHVVRAVTAIGIWKGRPVSLDLPPDVAARGHEVAVVVQLGGYGRIIGATPLARIGAAAAKP